MNNFMRFLFLVFSFFLLSFHSFAQNDGVNKEDRDWIPTGQWPFLNRRFLPATVVTGFVNKKKTVLPCNIHIGKHTLMYVKDDTLMEADPTNVNYVEFKNGDKYQSIGNVFAKIIQEDSIGKILMVRMVDAPRLRQNFDDISTMGSLTIGGDFGSISLDLMSAYVHNPEEEPLPIIDKFFFNFKMEIFEVTNKNVLNHINPQRKREYRAFTRSAEIITGNESSVRKIWENFFLKY